MSEARSIQNDNPNLSMDPEQPLIASNPADWGSIEAVVNAPLEDVAPDEWWISVVGMWLFLPLNLLQGLLGGFIQWFYVLYTIGSAWVPGSTSYLSAFGSVLQGRPVWLSFNFWRCVLAGVTALIAQGKSRLGLFLWEKAAMGDTGYFFQGEGIWTCPYALVKAILQSNQQRKPAFACIRACVPDLYASSLLIFLPNTSAKDSEWYIVRQALHQMFLDSGARAYRTRVHKLAELLAGEWKDPKVADLTNSAMVERLVGKCIFYVLFGVWIADEDAEILAGWRRNAFFFILPRLVQRFLFNLGINKVKKLRVDTVGVVEKYGQQDVFVRMNKSLPDKYRRKDVVKLVDEIMYVIGFAGIGGTCAAIDAVGAFLQAKLPFESPGWAYLDFGEYATSEKMVAKYKANPEKYIRETLRLVPPVTSATSSFAEDTKVRMAGRELTIPKGMLNQYVLSIANREESVFPKSKVFDPDRSNLNEAFTWNGAFGGKDEGSYPRICPGRHLSLDLIRIVVNHALGHRSLLSAEPPPEEFMGTVGCLGGQSCVK